jgi:hypothetical protein
MRAIETSAEIVTLKSAGGKARLVTPELLASMKDDAVALWRRLDFFGLRDSRTVYTLPQLAALQAEIDAQSAAEKAKAEAAESAAIEKICANYGTQQERWVAPGCACGPFQGILIRVDSLKSLFESTALELRILKNSPTQLRRAMKAAELKAAKAKDLAQFVKLCQKAARKLPAKPSAPLKGTAHNREHFPLFRSAKGRALWEAVPAAHKGTLKTRTGGTRCIASPEALEAFDSIIETLSASQG